MKLMKESRNDIYSLKEYEDYGYKIKIYEYESGENTEVIVTKQYPYQPDIEYTAEAQMILLQNIPPYELNMADQVLERIQEAGELIKKLKAIIIKSK